MKRRKKSSILFSATLATAGVVAGSLVAISNNSNAESFASMSLNDVVSSLSNELHIPENEISDVLDTKIVIAEVKDLEVLKNDPWLVDYQQIYGDFYSITYDTARETGIGYKTLKREEAIESITLNYTFEAKGFDNSSLFTSQRFDAGDAQAWGVSSMMLDTYADSLESKTNVVKIAVLDSGIRASHVIFSDHAAQDRLDMSLARNYVDYENPTSNVTDDNGHGTMVAGVIAESTPTNVKIVPIKILDANGECDFNSAFQGAAWAMNNGVKLMNMSIGATQADIAALEQQYNTEIVTPLVNFFATLENDGAIMVAAAGNESLNTIDYPAAAPSIITATSVNEDNSFSSHFSNHGQDADFAAPGNELMLPSYLDDYGVAVFVDSQGNETLPSGTSFSSPFVAAAIADILMEHPTWNKTQVMNELKLNAEDLGSAGWDEYYGYGSLSFHVNKYADLTINSITPSSDWGTSSDVAVSASSSKYTITKYALVKGDVATVPEPSNWKSVATAGKTVNETYNVTENGTYTIWYKNSNNEIKRGTFTVKKIDTTPAAIVEDLSTERISDSSVRIKLMASDNESGLSHTVWHYKSTEESNYHTVSDNFMWVSTAPGVTASIGINHVFDDLPTGDYVAYGVVYNGVGLTTTSKTVTFHIQVPTDHVSIGDITITPETWTNKLVIVNVPIRSEISEVAGYRLIKGDSTTEPTAWGQGGSTSFIRVENLTENGTYTVWVKNATETAHKTFTISNIDKTAPTVSNLTASNLTSSSAKLTVNASDADSGIASVEWKYKLESASEYTSKSGTTTSTTLTGLSLGDYVAKVIVTDVAGNVTTSDEISFKIEEGAAVSDTVNITKVEVPSDWSKEGINVTVKVTSEVSDITHRALVNGNATTEPAASAWTELSNQGKTLTDTVKVTANGTYTVWYKNASGETARESFTVNSIDTAAPVIDEELASSEVSEGSAKLTVSASDAGSGIAKIEWYYKLEGADKFEVEVDSYISSEIFRGLANGKTHTFSNLAAGNYIAYAVIFDKAGNTVTTPQITFTIQGDPITDPTVEPVDPVVTNPKTNDGISIIYMIGGAVVALGAAAFTKIRRR